MQRMLFALSLTLLPFLARAQETNGSWVIQKEFPRVLHQQAPKVQFGGSVGSVGTDKLGARMVGSRSEIYTVQSSEEFAPDLIKAGMDKWFKATFSSVHSSTTGSQQDGFVSHDWAYYEKKSGIAGRLTIWFPDTNAKPMKMVVVIDERKSR